MKFRLWELSRFCCKMSNDGTLNPIPFFKCEVADSDAHERNQKYSYGETPFRLSKRIIFKNMFPDVLDYPDFEARINVKSF